MSTRTSIFCQIMTEKNQVKDAYPPKKKKTDQNVCLLTHLYPLLPGLIAYKESHNTLRGIFYQMDNIW